MLTSFGKHGLFDLTVQVEGDLHIDAHHTVEDTAIALGQAFAQAAGDKAGTRRFGDALIPMDECLVQAAVDLSGRPYLVHTEPDGAPPTIGPDYATTLTRHVFESFTYHAAIALHVIVHGGRDWHHITEAQYKAVARALRAAVELDPRVHGRPVHEGRALSRVTAVVVVLDYGSGNLRSAQRALERVGADVTVTADAARGRRGRRLVVPGVGAFAACMAGLDAVGGGAVDRRAAGRAGGRCSASASACRCCSRPGVEHGVETAGLGVLPGRVEQLRAPVLPHMGWNTVRRAGRLGAVRRARRRHPVLLRALLRRAPTPTALVPRAEHGERVRRRRRARAGQRDPVPPGEVRRRRRDAARELAGDAVSTRCRR